MDARRVSAAAMLLLGAPLLCDCGRAPPDRTAFCGVPWTEASLVALVSRSDPDLHAPPRHARRGVGDSFVSLAMALSADLHGTGSPKAARALRRLMLRGAEADALAWTEEQETSRQSRDRGEVFPLRVRLLPLLTAWEVVRRRAPPDPEEAAAVEAWLGGLVELAEADAVPARTLDCRRAPDWFDSHCNGDAYLRDAVTLKWGILAGDDERVQQGLAGYRDAVARMRRDGGMPGELGRGSRALWYTRQALASLVFTAETAASHGVDLYGYEVDGRSLHRAIRFFLDAIEDPDLVVADAAANHRPGPRKAYRMQQLSFLEPRGSGRHLMAWVEPYVARFPESDNARRLARLSEGRLLTSDRPLIDELAGGNATCFYAVANP